MGKKIVIIGAGMGGLGTACVLAKAGNAVTVIDNNEQPGGRNSIFTDQGFTFNLGPSWYLMPEVFERFFELLGEDIGNHLSLQRLTPSYRVFYKDTLFGAIDIYGDQNRDGATFESFEPGTKTQLQRFLQNTEEVYDFAMEHLLYKNYGSNRDLLARPILRNLRKLNMLSSLHSLVGSSFKSKELQKLLEYPSLFLGSSPYNLPAFYSVLNHVDLNQGVFYPKGGMYALTNSLVNIAKKHGAVIACGQEASKILVKNGQVRGVRLSSGEQINADAVISNAGVQNTEQNLLSPIDRMYSNRYWRTRTLAPSALLIHLGVSGSLPQLQHHNLMFSKMWKAHFDSLFKKKAWKGDPSIYICNPSKTDASVAPPGHENLTILVPVAAGLSYDSNTLETYADHILQTAEQTLHLDRLRSRIVYKRLFCVKDFAERYHAPKGTAFGLSHILRQTAALRPLNKHKKVSSLYFVGADTTPGIGIPMCLISAELVSRYFAK